MDLSDNPMATLRSKLTSLLRFVDGLIGEIRNGKYADVNRDAKEANRITIMSRLRGRSVWIVKHDQVGESEDLSMFVHNRDQELEEYAKFAYWSLGLSYAVLYCLLSATLGRTGDKPTVMMGVHVWSILIMLLFSVSWFIRRPKRTLKVARIIMAGVLVMSTLFVFVLLQITL